MTDGQQAGSDGGRAGERIGSGEHDGPRTGQGDRARTGDGVLRRVDARAVEDQRVVIDDRARTERARGRAGADLERAEGDRERAGESVGAFEDEDTGGGLGDRAAAVDLRDVPERAGLELQVIDRTGERTDGEAVEVERGVVEAQGRGDRSEAVAHALADRVADVDRAAGDDQRRHGIAVGVRRAAEDDGAVDGDGAAGDVHGARCDLGRIVGRGAGGDVQAGRTNRHRAAGDVQRTRGGAGLGTDGVGAGAEDDGSRIERARAHAERSRGRVAVITGASADAQRAREDVDGVSPQIHIREGQRACRRGNHADVDGRAARARAIADDKRPEGGVEEVHQAVRTVGGDGDGVDVQGIDARAQTQRLGHVVDRSVHDEARRDDGAGRSEDQLGSRAAAGAAVVVGGVAHAEGTAGEAGIERRQARHVDDRPVRDVGGGVGAELDIDEGGVADAADDERAATVKDQARDGAGAGVITDGDRAVDAQGVTGADGDDVVGERAARADDHLAEGRAAGREIQLRDDGGAGDVAEVEHAGGVELPRGGDDDLAGAAEGHGAVAGDDVAGGHDVVVRPGEDQGAVIVDRAAADGADRAERADLGGRRGGDRGRAGVGVGAEEGEEAGAGQVQAGLARTDAQGVLDHESQGSRAAEVSEDRVGAGAAVADQLVAGDGARAQGQRRDRLIEAAEVEAAGRAGSAQGQGADGEGVVRAEAGGAVRDHRAAGVVIGAAEGQDAAARIADRDAGVGRGLDEGATEGDDAGVGEGQRGGADAAVADGLITGDAEGREVGEGLAEAVELERRALADAAQHDLGGVGPGGRRTDDEGAVLDLGGARIAIDAGERQHAAVGHAAHEVTGAVDGVGEGKRTRAGYDERTAVRDDGRGRQGAVDRAHPDLQRGAGSDRGRPLIGVRAREHEGARVDREAADAADDGADGGRAGRVDLEGTIDGEGASPSDRAAGAEGQDLTGAHQGAAVMAEGAGDGHVAAADDGNGTGAGGGARVGEDVAPVEGEQGAGSDRRGTQRTARPHLERARGDGRPAGQRVRAGQDEGAGAGLGEGQRSEAAVGEDAGESLRARSDVDRERGGRRGDAVDDGGRADRGMRAQAGKGDRIAGELELTGRTGTEGEAVAGTEGARGAQGEAARAVQDDVARKGVGRAEHEVAAVDREAAGDGLSGLEHERARVDDDPAGEGVTDVGEGHLSRSVLDDAGRAGDAEVAAEGVRQGRVVERDARGNDRAFADLDRTGEGGVIEDDGVVGTEVGRGVARDDTEIVGAARNMPNRVGSYADFALPADGVAGDEEGELAEVVGDERAGLTAAETGDRTDGEGGEVRQRGGEISEQVGTVGQRAAVDGRERD